MKNPPKLFLAVVCLSLPLAAQAVLIGQYTFENDRTTPTPDIYNDTTSAYDATNIDTTLVEGDQINYRTFNGTSAYITHDTTLLRGESAVSANIWFNSSTSNVNGVLVGAENSYSFQLNSTDNGTGRQNGGLGQLRIAIRMKYIQTPGDPPTYNYAWSSAFFSDETTLNDGKWHMGTFTFDGSNVYMYVDGVQQSNSASVSLDTPVINPDSGNPEIIGRYRASHASLFTGDMTDIRYYDNALSSTDVLNLYNATKGNFVPEPSTYAMLAGVAMLGLAWWRRRKI